jgi:hypothetical protein
MRPLSGLKLNVLIAKFKKVFAELDCDFNDLDDVASKATEKQLSPRKSFGVRDWDVFICGLFQNVTGVETSAADITRQLLNGNKSDAFLDEVMRLRKFESVVWLYCRYFFLAQPLPKKQIAREECARIFWQVIEDCHYGLENNDHTGNRKTGKKRSRTSSVSNETMFHRLVSRSVVAESGIASGMADERLFGSSGRRGSLVTSMDSDLTSEIGSIDAKRACTGYSPGHEFTSTLSNQEDFEQDE